VATFAEEAKTVITPLLARVRRTLREVNIVMIPVLHERYSWDIPVDLHRQRGGEASVDPQQFRRQLRCRASGNLR